MPTPTISVVMAVYRPHPRHFPEAVASVLAQTFRDFEFVIVEDPSERSASALLAAFDDRRIRLIANPERTGLIAQRNRTLMEAQAEWVALLDADDRMEPDRLAKQWEYLQSHPGVDVLGSRLSIIDGDGRIVGARSYPQSHADILRSFRRFNAIAQPTAVARKAAMLASNGYSFEFPAEDYDLWSRMANAGAKFANHPEALTRYRIGGATKSDRLRKTLRLTREVKRRYWWTRMGFTDRLRYYGEGCLIGLPAGAVEWMFRRWTYGKAR